jgi:aspartyl aminopeptidase
MTYSGSADTSTSVIGRRSSGPEQADGSIAPLPASTDEHGAAERLITFIDASPSPYHAVATATGALAAEGFVELDERETWPSGAGRYVVRRGGSLVAWAAGESHAADAPVRIVGAHTDSPNLRIKARPDTGHAGFRQLGVEVYGGVLLNSWLDRDLGISGRVVVDDGGVGEGAPAGQSRPCERLLRVDRPLLRVPQLAIHLDREIMTKGLLLNPQQHVVPVWGAGAPDVGGFVAFLAGELRVEPEAILAWEVMTHDLVPGARLGRDRELVSAPRIDNLCSSWAGIEALVAAAGAPTSAVPVLCLFDHEEVGSTSDRGAGSTMLPSILERAVSARGGDRDAFHRSLAGSACVSADMAHATHPNYADRHEPNHHIAVNGGPVLKANANLRYASDATSAALFELACRQARVPLQRYIHRTDLPCGSTIGPITAAQLGIPTVDVGAPQLSMHSARELCGAADPAMYVAALTAFLAPAVSMASLASVARRGARR